MWGQIELSRAAVAHAGASCAAGMSQAEIASLAAKAQAGVAVEYVAKWAFQLHGAIGYTSEYELGGLARGALSLNLWLGSATKMRRTIVELERKSLGKSENG
jgi:alkylation response protein AidB-like acyl-CoA dehydrogenase